MNYQFIISAFFFLALTGNLIWLYINVKRFAKSSQTLDASRIKFIIEDLIDKDYIKKIVSEILIEQKRNTTTNMRRIHNKK